MSPGAEFESQDGRVKRDGERGSDCARAGSPPIPPRFTVHRSGLGMWIDEWRRLAWMLVRKQCLPVGFWSAGWRFETYHPFQIVQRFSKAMPIKKTIEKDSTDAPNTTKKMSLYLYFCKIHRQDVTVELQKNPDFDPKDVLRKMGEMWRAQTDEQKNE